MTYHVRLIGKMVKYDLPSTSPPMVVETNMDVHMMIQKEEHLKYFMVV